MTITDSRPAETASATNGHTPDATNSRPATQQAVSIPAPPGVLDSPATSIESKPRQRTSRGTKTAGRHSMVDDQDRHAAGVDPAAIPDSTPKGSAPQDEPGPAGIVEPEPILRTLLDPALSLAADILDDIERVRIANENRVRQLTRAEVDVDGEERGFGLPVDHPDVMALTVMVEALKTQEHQAVLNLQRKLRRHPLGPWMKGQRGVGEKQGARLLAAIGDPYINSAKGEPRTVSALWAYCGLHVLPASHRSVDAQRASAGRDQLPADPGPDDARPLLVVGAQHGGPQATDEAHRATGVAAKRRKGERANWSTKAKMRAYLIAERCVVTIDTACRDAGYPHAGRDVRTHTEAQAERAVAATNDRGGQTCLDDQRSGAAPVCACSPYRVVYDLRRRHTAVTHPDWTDGHSHNDALRVASKEILKDLWRAARDWHLAQTA